MSTVTNNEVLLGGIGAVIVGIIAGYGAYRLGFGLDGIGLVGMAATIVTMGVGAAVIDYARRNQTPKEPKLDAARVKIQSPETFNDGSRAAAEIGAVILCNIL